MAVFRLLRIAHQRVRAVFRRDTVDDELANELTFHLDQLTEEFIERGFSAADARQAARRAIGNLPLLEEQCRDTRTVTWLHDLRQDVIYGVRMLRKHPGFTTVALLSLALGIGANTAILSVIDAVTRDRLPVPDDDRVVVLRTYPFDNPAQETHALVIDYFAWRDESRSFDVIGVAMGNNADFGADSHGAPSERIAGQSMTPDAFAALGVQPTLGRFFTDDDVGFDTPTRVIVLSYRLWQRRFGGRPDIVGQEVRLDRVNRTVIGVMPDRFRYPSEVTDYWIPMQMDRSQTTNPQRFFVVTARLKPGVTVAQAQADVDGIAWRLAATDKERHEGWGVRVKPLREAMFAWSRERLFTLQAAVALVLLVACANLAGLLLARGLVRGPEMALRTALGAGHGRLVRQLLTESVLLAIGGGALGLAVAWIGTRALVSMNPPPGGVAITDITLSGRTLVLTGAIAMLTGVFYGLVPALLHARAPVTDTLKESFGTLRTPRLRSALVAVQIAVTVVLLIGAGLLMRSFVRVMSRDLGFDTDRLLTFELRFPTSDYMRRNGTFAGLPYFDINPSAPRALERIHERLRALPGVESVAGVSTSLLNSVVIPSASVSLHRAGTTPDAIQASGPPATLAIGVGRDGSHVDNRRSLTAAYFLVTPAFFTSIKASLLTGRDIGDRDTAVGEWVVVVNESAANRFWPGQNPVGQTLTILNSPEERPRKVIGIVRDIPLTVEGDMRPAIYTSFLQQPSKYPLPGANMFGQMAFMVRSTGDPMSLLPSARHLVAEIDQDRPLASVGTMQSRLLGILPQRGYVMGALMVFALAATLLAAIGIYGVMAYSVAQRTREIGIRIALGAGGHQIAALVGRRTVQLVAVGLLVGLVGATIATELIRSQLWGVTPTDPVTFVAVSALFVLVAFAAAFFPTRRAIAVNPTTALRCE
jgi:putative ABC transport system permease protein